MKKRLYTLFKIPLKDLIKSNFDMHCTTKEGLEKGFLIKQTDSPIFDQIERLRGRPNNHIPELILLEAKKNPKTESDLRYVLSDGFLFNDNRYVRFGKSASQGKNGITAFVREDIYDELYMITEMDIKIGECVISKYEAQRCLVFSSCTLVKNYIPRIVIIDEYEKIIKDKLIRYVVSEPKEFADKETGEIKTYNLRRIEEGVHDIKLSPFDGCGCHEIEFAETTSAALGLDYMAIGNQVRMPFVKGYSVYVPFREIYKEMGVTEITDVYGVSHNIDDIDCIWNTSMFKGHKIFKQKYGSDAWNKYMETFIKYQFKLGISKYSHHVKNLKLKARMNFQYLQCLDLWNPKYIEHFKHLEDDYNILDEENAGKVIELAKYTTGLFEKVISGDKFYTYKFMGVTDTSTYEPESKYIEAALANDVMLKDPAVKRFIYRKLQKYINEAKLGKIYGSGFYHTIVGDMIGYLEYAAGKEPVGCLNAGEFFCETIEPGDCVSFRSPLVCPSEVNKIKIVTNDIVKKWFSYFKNQDVVMFNMYDISAPQQGGADFDGDIVFLCNDPIIINSKIDKPIIIDIEDKVTAVSKEYTKENLIEYELMTRDSRIGEITNVGTSIENKYTENPEIKKRYSDYASLLRILQGKEIDYLKTGVRWHMNASLRKYMKKLPYFLLYNYPKKLDAYNKIQVENKNLPKEEKRALNAFKSPSPMNELCEYICKWEKNLMWNNEYVDTRCLITNTDYDYKNQDLLRASRYYISKYQKDFSVFISKFNCIDKETQEMYMSELSNKYINLIKDMSGCDDEVMIANYVIYVSYQNLSSSKIMAWNVFGDYIIKNLKDNSNPRKVIRITEAPYKTNDTYEYLGKNYYMTSEGE